MKISLDLMPRVYSTAKEVYRGRITATEGKHFLSSDKAMNTNSAADFINSFKCLMDGQRFTRTLNAPSMDFMLEHILLDFGQSKLNNAIRALKEHIEYYEAVQKNPVRLRKMRAVYAKYVVLKPEFLVDEEEQAEIIDILKNTLSREQIKNELLNLVENDPEVVVINLKAFKRDNKTVAQIKILRDFKCQICGNTIYKKDGTKYIEAAHIHAKHLKGVESPSNIILLCPNHHKEFDLGDRQIISHTPSEIHILLNGNTFKLNLSIE